MTPSAMATSEANEMTPIAMPTSQANETALSAVPIFKADVMFSYAGLTPVIFELEAQPAVTPSSFEDIVTCPPCPSVETAFSSSNPTPSAPTSGCTRHKDQQASPSTG